MIFAQWLKEVNKYLSEAKLRTNEIDYPYWYAYDMGCDPEDIAGELLCDNFGH